MNKFKLLRLLAADTGANGGTGTGDNDGNSGTAGTDGNSKGQDETNKVDNQAEFKLPTSKKELDDFLQKESDKRVTSALKKSQEKWEKDYASKLDVEKKEAERLAKMSESEKSAELIKQKEEALAAKEAELANRELKLEAIKILNEQELPVQFVDFILGNDADSTDNNIKTFKTQWKNAIDKAVTEKLKGHSPNSGLGEIKSKGAEDNIGAKLAKQSNNNKSLEDARNAFFK